MESKPPPAMSLLALSPPSLPIMINYNKNSLEFLVIKCP